MRHYRNRGWEGGLTPLFPDQVVCSTKFNGEEL